MVKKKQPPEHPDGPESEAAPHPSLDRLAEIGQRGLAAPGPTQEQIDAAAAIEARWRERDEEYEDEFRSIVREEVERVFATFERRLVAAMTRRIAGQ